MSELKTKSNKDIFGNQNYLNFIKKNHQLIQQQFSQEVSNIRIDHDKAFAYHSNTMSPKQLPSAGEASNKKESSKQKKAIHDSLSKFKTSNQYGQIQNLYDSKSTRQIQQNIYTTILKKNDDIANNLMNNKIALTRKKNLSQDATKDILFHLNKNRSLNGKKVEMKKIHFDRYQSIQSQQVVELNLKFPEIGKKNIATVQVQHEKGNFLDELRTRMKQIEKRQKTSREEENMSIHKEQIEVNEEKQSNPSGLQKRHSESRTRQQLYGLLPSFRLPNPLSDHKKKHRIQKSIKLRIQVPKEFVGKQLVGEYLQNNIITKSISIPQKRVQKSRQKGIFNRQILDTTSLNNKQQLQLIQGLNQQQNGSILIHQGQQSPSNDQSSQLQHKKSKKQGPVALKYQGDFSIYDIKIRSYRQFLFMINLAHKIYDPINLKDANSFKPEQRYKFYLGKGNNYLLVKSLLKRRFWWTVQEDQKKANFVWTQLKVNNFYQYQKKTEKKIKNNKLDKDFQIVQQPKKKKKQKKQQQSKQIPKTGTFKAPLPSNDKKVFTNCDKKYYDEFLEKAADRAQNPEKLLKFSNRIKYFEEDFFRSRVSDLTTERVHNHLEFNYFIGNKKALFYNLKQFYDLQNKNVFEVIPLTFHIKHGTTDPQYEMFRKQFSRLSKEKLTKKLIKNVWIVKPGQLSNRGQGITVIDEIYQLNTILKKKQKHFNGTEKTYIVQKYIQKPLLYKGRKFDIRHYMMISKLHGTMRAYWFGEGYIRTSSAQFNIDDIGQQSIHLTNDAIQKYCQSYGKYQEGNKVSYNQFQRYMDATYGQGKFNFSQMIYPRMKEIALDAVKATYLMLDPNSTQHNFEIFGLDFMIDVNYGVWLIEVNTNPCLELSSKLLARVIPTMVEQSLRLTLDVIFPPPTQYPNSQKYLAPDNPLQRLQFQLIFDEDRDGQQIQTLYANAKTVDMGQVDEQDETYQNDGNQIQLDNEIE